MPQPVPSTVSSKVQLNDLLAVFGFTINFYFVCILHSTPTIFIFLLVIADALSLFLSLFVTNEVQRHVLNSLQLGIRNDLTLTSSYLYMLYNAQFVDNESNHVHAPMEAQPFQVAFENAMMHVTANRTINIPVQVVNQSDESMSVSVSTLTAPSDSMDTSSALP
jgi:hypothetical protein